MRQHLVKHTPEALIEYTRQPLFWNPRVRTSDNMMIGKLKGLGWEKFAQTKLHSIGDWRQAVAPGGAREDLVKIRTLDTTML